MKKKLLLIITIVSVCISACSVKTATNNSTAQGTHQEHVSEHNEKSKIAKNDNKSFLNNELGLILEFNSNPILLKNGNLHISKNDFNISLFVYSSFP